MSLFGGKEKKEIQQLQQQIVGLQYQVSDLSQRLSPEHQNIMALQAEIQSLHGHKESLENDLRNLAAELSTLHQSIQRKRGELIELDDEVLYQEFALYRPTYDFARSDQYKERLAMIRQMQKDMIKNETATNHNFNWEVSGSKQAGKKLVNDTIKQILRSFNTECENAIDRVKFNNFESMQARIQKSYDALNKLNASLQVSVSPQYLYSKIEELKLALEYAMKKQAEKEEQKRIREELREQARLAKELEEARRNIEKEQNHYNNAMQKVEAQIVAAKTEEERQLLEEKKQELVQQLDKLDASLKNVDYREANQKAGYVYIISNIGAFGEDVYKIGMTRRLDPTERVDELGDASVPFRFDTHAMIFCEDAPRLEAALHRAFDDRKVNMVNSRKEFFRCSLEEIKDVVRANFDQTVEFIDVPEAEHYRMSVRMREQLQ